MGDWGAAVLAIVTAIIGLAIVAVLVSQRSNTSGVLQSAGGALGGLINAAVSPVTGGTSGMPNMGVGTQGALIST